MIKYYHELRKEEYLWLVKEGTTYAELEKDFPQPSWCEYPQATSGLMGCWSLIDFESGYSRVTGVFFCLGCPLYLENLLND